MDIGKPIGDLSDAAPKILNNLVIYEAILYKSSAFGGLRSLMYTLLAPTNSRRLSKVVLVSILSEKKKQLLKHFMYIITVVNVPQRAT